MKTYRQTTLAIALFALAGAAAAQTSPSTTTPMQGHPSTTPPSTTAPGMTPGGQPSTPSAMSPSTRMPTRTDSADSAYKALDPSNRGYLSKSDVQGISGFNFDQADANRDGRLSKDEFSKAWSVTK